MKIHIIGGGIIGLCSAWFLKEEGFEVTVIDRTDLSDGASHGNAGMIVPSHFMPLASPGVIAKGIRWMFNSRSPFFIKPRLDLALAQWLWQFYRSCSQEKVDRAMGILKTYNEQSRDLYRQFSGMKPFEFCFEEKGLLMLYRDAKTEKEEAELAETAHELGIKAQVLSGGEVQELEKGIRVDVRGGVYYPGDAHLYPNLFIGQLISELKNSGVTFLPHVSVGDIETEGGRLSQLHLSDGTRLAVDQVVLAAGSWSARTAKKWGVKMLMQDGKGYSVTLKQPPVRPSIPTILTEAKVAVTPMGDDLRVGGTLEISNFSDRINPNRLAGILDSMPRYYPDIHIEPSSLQKVWHGFRPCTPDGLPYLGRSGKYSNLIVAAGHAMLGMSLGPATGRLVAEIATGKPPSLNISLFEPDRF